VHAVMHAHDAIVRARASLRCALAHPLRACIGLTPMYNLQRAPRAAYLPLLLPIYNASDAPCMFLYNQVCRSVRR
jgi:hypothetical protein